MTPLYTACYYGSDDVVQVLLDHGVEVDVPNKVSDILCIHIELYNTVEANEIILVA